MSGLVLFVVPYQFAFTATLLWLIWINARALNHARQQSRSAFLQTTMAWNHFHFSMSILVMFFFLLPFCIPALTVWIRNFAIGWFKSFDSDHRVDYVLPFLIFVEGLSHVRSADIASWKR
jgi:hypothetical protein